MIDIHISNWGGVGFSALLILFFPAVGLHERWRNRKTKLPALTTEKLIPPVHIHQIECDRSKIMVTDNGAVYGRCAIIGCEEPIFIGQGVLAFWRARA